MIASRLRARGHDVVAALERGWQETDDESLLIMCDEDRRALLTNNVADFMTIARRWAAEGRRHSGLVLTSDTSMPRNRSTIGRYVTALDKLIRSNAGDDAFVDRVHWL
jgi:hypothetical protein